MKYYALYDINRTNNYVTSKPGHGCGFISCKEIPSYTSSKKCLVHLKSIRLLLKSFNNTNKKYFCSKYPTKIYNIYDEV